MCWSERAKFFPKQTRSILDRRLTRLCLQPAGRRCQVKELVAAEITRMQSQVDHRARPKYSGLELRISISMPALNILKSILIFVDCWAGFCTATPPSKRHCGLCFEVLGEGNCSKHLLLKSCRPSRMPTPMARRQHVIFLVSQDA